MRESIKYTAMKAARRVKRVRSSLKGTSARPRMSVHISGAHMSVQFIDDGEGRTILAVHDKILVRGLRHVKVEDARELGKKAAQAARAKGISAVIFDRGSRSYHGRIKAFADGAREGGLIF